MLTPVPTPNHPFLDPPVGGYNYSPCGTPNPDPAANTANPFYFNPTGSASDCFTVAANVFGNTLTFGDEPMDPHLTATQIAAGNIPKFTTELVGILPGNIPGPPLFVWTWDTTYNGSTGYAARSANLPDRPEDQPDFCPTCTGHVFITSINGVPVPEPSSLIILASSLLATLGLRRGRARVPPRSGYQSHSNAATCSRERMRAYIFIALSRL